MTTLHFFTVFDFSIQIHIGPSWLPSLNTLTTLLSIRSLMVENPYHNEPGYEKTTRKHYCSDKDVGDYNALITHETMRVAVIAMLRERGTDTYGMPTALREIMRSHFVANYEFYETLIKSHAKLDGQQIRDPFRDPIRPKTFMYKEMMNNLAVLKEKLCGDKVDAGTTPIYDKIAKELLHSNYRDVLPPISETSDDSVYCTDDDDNLGNLDEILYESQTDDDGNDECNENA